VYLVSEDNEAVQVVVSTNEEHLTQVSFQLVFTSTSARGMSVRLLLGSHSSGLYYHTSFV